MTFISDFVDYLGSEGNCFWVFWSRFRGDEVEIVANHRGVWSETIRPDSLVTKLNRLSGQETNWKRWGRHSLKAAE